MSMQLFIQLNNPFLGGIGNWKIISLKYDAENIKNYIIPYNAHNDVLEAFLQKLEL